MSEAPTARTIRLYCDGELPDEQARQVEEQLQQDPRPRARVEFERRLKQRVDQVMQADRTPVPAGLAGRIRQTLAASEGRPQDSGAAGSGAVAGRIDVEPQPAPVGSAWWRGPNRANIFAVAACLALVAGAVLFGILGPPIDTLRAPGAADATVEAAAAVAGEHVNSTLDPLMMVAGTVYRTPGDARQGLAEHLGVLTGIFDLSDLGYEFVAGKACAVPHFERACHLFYRRYQGESGLVSLHIVPDHGQFGDRGDPFPGSLPLSTDVIPEGPRCQKDVLVWSHGGRSYLLVVCLDEDAHKVARRMQETLLDSGPAPRG